MNFLKLILFALFLKITKCQISIYNQCGGLLYQGSTICLSGLTCVIVNPYYSQCLPGGSQQETTGYFVAKNKKLYDANGKEFLMRGVNSAHAWWDNFGRNYALKSIPFIAKSGSNTVRIAWEKKVYSGSLSLSDLENVIKKVIEYKMIPMVELHDATGSTSVNDLLECAKWFKNNIDLFKRYKKYILINIANEWSPGGISSEDWRDAYKQAISIVRSSGWAGALVIDAGGYGQIPDGPLKYGTDLIRSDPNQNLIFSVHMYGLWRPNPHLYYVISEKLSELQNKGLTIIVGEFTYKIQEGCNWVTLDIWEIMRSWHGNGQGDCNKPLTPLNMVNGDAQNENSWKTNDYSEWGNHLIYYQGYGIKDTSVKASYFV